MRIDVALPVVPDPVALLAQATLMPAAAARIAALKAKLVCTFLVRHTSAEGEHG